MKVLIIYSSECKDEVSRIRNDISNRFGKKTVLRMNSCERGNERKRKIRLKHAWHFDAIRMMKAADMIVYAVSKNSAKNKNVSWELKQVLRLKKHLVCLKVEKDAKINESLYYIDKNTKERTCIAEEIKDEESLFAIIEEYNNSSYIHLLNQDDPDIQVLLEQYKIFSESAEALVNRRQNMNSFYFSANTALITIAASIFALSDVKSLISKLVLVLAISVPGLLINFSWKNIIQSYYLNNKGKMKVLSLIERKLPSSLYDAEWKAMKNKYNNEHYVSFTDSEKKLPMVFIIFYMMADIAAISVLISSI